MKKIVLAIFGMFAPIVAAADDSPAPYVKIVTTEAAQGVIERQFFGRVAARQSVDLAFRVGGQIVDFPAIEGETVPQGEVIAQLDQEPFQLAFNQAELQRDQTQRTLSRLEQLRGNAASRVSIEDAQTSARSSDIALRNAELALKHATLRAPFDALVARRNVANYTLIAPGTPVVRLHDMSEIRIKIDVPEVLFQQTGGKGETRIEAEFVGNPTRYPLTLREFNAETSQVGQTFRISLGMAPPEGLNLLPGTSVTVHVYRHSGETEISLPASAVRLANDGAAQVMLFEPVADTADEGVVTLHPVEITPAPDGSLLVSSGLEAGQQVVASGLSRLTDGQQVRRFSGFPN